MYRFDVQPLKGLWSQDFSEAGLKFLNSFHVRLINRRSVRACLDEVSYELKLTRFRLLLILGPPPDRLIEHDDSFSDQLLPLLRLLSNPSVIASN
jgi:hypothetical protein